MESLYLPGNGCDGWMRVILAFVVAAGVRIGIARGDDAAGGAYEIQTASSAPRRCRTRSGTTRRTIRPGRALRRVRAGPGHRVRALADKVARAKPATLTDACWSRDDEPVNIAEAQVRGSGRCELSPSSSSPREVAGAPLASDIAKCQLKPVDPDDYDARFGPDEMIRLRGIFPGGVCDWSRPGAGQTGLKGTWLTFGST